MITHWNVHCNTNNRNNHTMDRHMVVHGSTLLQGVQLFILSTMYNQKVLSPHFWQMITHSSSSASIICTFCFAIWEKSSHSFICGHSHYMMQISYSATPKVKWWNMNSVHVTQLLQTDIKRLVVYHENRPLSALLKCQNDRCREGGR